MKSYSSSRNRVVNDQAAAKAKKMRPRQSMLALESRVVFDGAMLVGAMDVAHQEGVSADKSVAALLRASEHRQAERALRQGDNEQPSGAAERSTSAVSKILFVDSRLPDYQKILGATDGNVKVIVLDKNQDGLKQIAEALKQYQNLDSISIVSHGDDGVLLLGDTGVHDGNLARYQTELATIGQALKADGELLLYGCNVAAGDIGRSFIDRLANLTGATVAASNDDTGSKKRGGDWDLEISTGTLRYSSVLDVQKLNNWDYLAHTASVSSYAQLVSAISSSVGDGQDDTITLTSNITLGTGQTIAINVTDGHTLTIVGGSYTLSGGNLTRVLETNTTNSNSAVVLQNITIANGFVTGNGGSNNLNGAGGAGGSGLGGGIYNQGTLTITGSTITGNKASAGGGGGGTTSGLYGGGGGGGGGYGSGVGGAGGTGAGGNAGTSGSAGSGGDGGGAGGRGGSGGGATGGAGSTYTGAGYTAGGKGGSAANGGVKIGGGGGGTGTNGAGGAGGDAAGGIYNTATGTITILNSTVTNNIAAGGGGGGGGSADFASTGNGGDGGRGVGGIWNAGGIVRVDSTTAATLSTGNVGAGGLKGTASGTGNSNGNDGVATNTVLSVGGTYDPNYSIAPTITNATYDASTNILSVTGADMTTGDTILPSKLTLKGDNGVTYTLKSGNVTATNATSFSITLNDADQLVVEGMFNKTGTSSADTTTYNLSAASGWNSTASSAPADATNAVTVSAVSSPVVSSATYDASTGVLKVTGSGFVATDGATNDMTVTNLKLTGQGPGTYTLTSGNVEATDTTTFSVTLNNADKLAVNGLLNKDGTSAIDATTFNLAAASSWNTSLASADLTSNGITVTNVNAPSISTAEYDASTGVLKINGSNLVGVSGSTNDITATALTITGQGGDTYKLTSSDVEVTDASSFSITLSSTDKLAINGLLNKTGTSAIDSTTFNVSAASGWNSALASADSTNAITVSNVTGPVITSATYDASTGTLVVTGTNFVGKVGASNDITVVNLTLLGEGGNTYALTSSDVELDNANKFTVSLNSTDKLFINGLLNKTGTKAVDTTTYNVAAASSWNTALAAADLTSNGVTVANVQAPTISSATYNSVTGVLAVTGSNLVAIKGSANDIDVSALTFKGLGSGVYSLVSSGDVDITDATSFSVTLNSTDQAGLAVLLDKAGTKSSDNVTYNLEASDDWNSSIADADITDSTNAVTVSIPAPSISKVVQTSGNGYYKAGDTVTLAVYFDQSVTVDTAGGTPSLLLETGSTDQSATYTSGSGSKILTFSYTVQAGDTSNDLQYFDTSSLGLGGATVKATLDSAVDATLTLPATNSGNSLAELSALVIDTTAPGTSTPDMVAASDSGTSSTDDITNDTTPTFEGTAEANATVTLYHSDGATQIGTTTADGSGNWSITSSALTDNSYTVKTRVTDAAGNQSSLSTGVTITIDTTAPTAPTSLDLPAAFDSGYFNNDNVTNQTTVSLNLSAEKNSTVTVYDSNGSTVLATGTTNGSGSAQVTKIALSETAHNITVKATDAAGNTSSASSTLKVTVDTTAPTGTPATPVLASSSDTGSSNSDGETKNDSPTISGSGLEADGYVEVYDGASLVSSPTVDGSGNWSDTLSGLSEGSHSITVKEYDLAGNLNSTTSGALTIKVDTTAPTAPGTPVLDSASDTGSANNDQNTSDDTPNITGTADANVSVTLYDTDGTTVLGTTTSDGSGNWSITSKTLSETTHTLTAKATDVAGNVSTVSSGLAVTIDTTAPTTSIATLKFSNDTGSSSTDFITKTAAQTISGTTSANILSGESVEISLDNGSTWVPATTSVGDNTWTLSGQTLAATNTMKVRVVDAAGNAGTAASQKYELDQSAPSASTITLDSASDTGSSSSDGNTTVTTPVINGVSEAGAIIILYDTDGTTELGTTTADGSGKWSITSKTLSEATHTLTVKAIDAAGNVGTVSSDLTVTVDLTAPTASAPNLDASSDSGRSNSDDITSSTTPAFTGTAELGSMVTLYDSKAGSLGSIATDGSGNWTITSSKLTEGAHDISIKVTDAAGNVSAASSALTVEVDTTVPTAPTIKLDPASDSGISSSDGITNIDLPTFTGTTEGYAIINLYSTNSKGILATTTADSLGNWSVKVSQPLAGTHTVTAEATDKAGNVSSKSSGFALNVDTTAPALFSKMTISDTAFKVGDTATVKFVFTEKVTNFTTADVTVGNGKLSSLASSDGGTTWTATLTPTTGVTASVNMLTLDNTTYTDLAGNAGVGSSNSGNYSVDTEAPVITGSISVSDTALKSGDTATVTLVFSEAVTDFDVTDLNVANGTVKNLASGDGGITWTATLTPTDMLESASNVITLDLTGVQDLNGNAGAGSQDSVNYSIDTKAPALTITSKESTLKAGETATITFTFSEDPGGSFTWDGTSGDVVVSGGTLSAISGTGTTRTATFTPTSNTNSGSASITVAAASYTDTAGNSGGAGTSPSLSFDTLAPTVGSVSVPANASYAVGQNLNFTVHFNENVTVDTTGGTPSIALTLDTGGTVQATYVSGSGSSDLVFRYTVAATNLDTDGVTLGSVIVLNSGTLTDVAGNTATLTLNSVAATTGVLVDGVLPTVASINRANSNNTNASTVDYTVTFSENVSGVDVSDFALTKVAGTAAGTVSKVTAVDGKTYTVTVNGLSGTGDLRLDLNSSGTGIADTVTNAIAAGYTAGQSYSVDYDGPTLDSVNISDTALKVGDTATLTFKFNEAVSGFDLSDIASPNGVISNLSTTDNITWTATLTPDAAVTAASNVLTVKNTAYTDLVGNSGKGSTDSGNYAIDTLAPTVASVSVPANASYGIGQNLNFTVHFNENVIVDTTGGTPSIALTLDTGGTVQATYVSGSGSSDLVFRYTVAATNLDTDGVSLGSTIVANGATLMDAAGNSATLALNSVASTAVVLVDGVVPAVASIVRASSNNTNAATIDYTVTFTENVSGVDVTDFALTKVAGTPAGSISKVTAIDGKTYTVTLGSLSGTGDLRLDLNSSGTGIADTASNAIAAGYSAGQTYSVDYDAPSSSSMTISDTAFKMGDTATVTFKFNEAVSGFDIGDVNAPNGTLSNLSTKDNISWTATLTPNATTTAAVNVLTLNNTGYTDLVGNSGKGNTNSGNYAIDTVVPVLASSITISDTAFKIGDSASVTFTFNEAITDFEIADVTVENGVLSNLITGDGGITWTAVLTPTDGVTSSKNMMTVDYTGVLDLAGNAGTGKATSGNYAVDTVRPSLASSITINDTALKIGDTATVTFTFTEAVTKFTTADVLAPNGVLSNLTTGDGGITWTATLTPNASTTATGNVLTLDYTGVFDLAGNAGSGSATSSAYAVDTTQPTATIVVTDNDLRAGETSLVTITFSEAVTNFDNSDLSIANGTLSNVSSSDGGTTWTATLTPSTAIIDPTNLITLTNKGVQDLAGNDGTGSTDSNNYAVSTVRPTASISVAGSALNSGSSTQVTITFSEAVTGLDLSDFTVESGTLSALSSSDGGVTWRATLTPDDGVEVSANHITLNNTGYQNSATNTGLGTTSSGNYAVDTLVPGVVITSNRSVLGGGQSATLTFTLSEASTSFSAADVIVSGGTLSNFSGSGNVYTATYTPAPDSTAPVSINIASASFTDLAGNANLAAAQVSLSIDTGAPTVTMTSSDSQLQIGETSTLSFTLSEDSTDFDASDIRISGGALSNFQGSGRNYTATFTPATNTAGDVQISINSGSFADALGNKNSQGANLTLATDLIAPTMTVSANKSALGAGESATLTFTLSENATDFGAGDISVSGGSLSNFSGSGKNYTATFTATTEPASTGRVSVNAGVFTDAAGNANLAASTLNMSLDTVPPVAPTIPDLAASSDTGTSNTDNMTSNNRPTWTGTAEPGSRVSVFDGSTLLGVAIANGSGNWSFTPTDALAEGSHVITARATDAASNTGPSSGGLALTIDATAPSAPAAPRLADGGTNSTTSNVVLRGTDAVPGTVITIYADGVAVGSDTVNAAGNWTVPGVNLSAGTHLVTATATDPAGNVSPASAASSIIITPPVPRSDNSLPAPKPISHVAPAEADASASLPVSGALTGEVAQTPISRAASEARSDNSHAANRPQPLPDNSTLLSPLVQSRPVSDISFAPGQLITFTIPRDTFLTSDGSPVTLKAVMLSADGKTEQPLPSWLRFDPVTGTFTGTPPGNAPTDVQIRVVARDSKGNEVSATFNLRNGKANADGKDGKAASTEGKAASVDKGAIVKSHRASGHDLLAALGLLGSREQGVAAGQHTMALMDSVWQQSDQVERDGAPALSQQLQREGARFSAGGSATLQHLLQAQLNRNSTDTVEMINDE